MKIVQSVIALLLFFSCNRSIAEIIVVTTKHEEIQTAYWPQPDSSAVLIWLPGGDGSFGIAAKNPPNPIWFLRNLAARDGAPDIVFMDSKYGLGWKGGELSPRRTSRHIDNVQRVIQYYQEKTGKKIFLLGHSNSSVSVAEYLNASPEHQRLLAGAIFSASRNETAVTAPLNLPVLVMVHEKDTNTWTTPGSSVALYEKIKSNNIAHVEFAYVQGGFDEGNPATSGRHMYAGSLDEAADIVYKFVVGTKK